MKNIRRVTLLTILAVLILGIYVLPGVTARLAGSHTWELNETGGPSALNCLVCHEYIVNEINNNQTKDAITAHLGMGSNVYLTGNSTMNGSIYIGYVPGAADPGDTNTYRRACVVCHEIQLGSAAAGQTHTQITIRVCTDCHGNSTHVGQIYRSPNGSLLYSAEGNIGRKLADSADMHSKFFLPLEGKASPYVSENENLAGGCLAATDTWNCTVGLYSGSANYTTGFYACLGCHTHLGLNKRVTRPNKMYVNFTYTTIDTEPTLESYGIEANYTNGTSQKGFGTTPWQ